jgi:hypothetical protein
MQCACHSGRQRAKVVKGHRRQGARTPRGWTLPSAETDPDNYYYYYYYYYYSSYYYYHYYYYVLLLLLLLLLRYWMNRVRSSRDDNRKHWIAMPFSQRRSS